MSPHRYLNIIANLLLADKTVLVVSNNNSAVENVAEKLGGENLGFIVAKLGSVQNKEAFTANQPDCPDMSGWVIEEEPVRQQVQDALHAVTQGFDAQMRQARLKAEYDALLKETKYHDMLQQESADNEWLHGKRSSKLMTLLNLYQLKVENKPKPDIWFRLKCEMFRLRFATLNMTEKAIFKQALNSYPFLRMQHI